MRIGLCSDSFLPVVDGVGRVVVQYARMLARRGHECYVITPLRETGYRGAEPFEIVDFLSVPTPTAPQYRTGIARLDKHYDRRISDVKLDIVHAHTPGFSGLEAARLAEKLGVPLVGTFHSQYYDDIRRATHSDMLAALGVRWISGFYEGCDEVWTVSRHAAGTLRSYGYMGKEIEIVPNGSVLREPDTAFEAEARQAFGLDNTPVLLYVGQMDKKKNLVELLEAVSICRRRGVRFRLVMAGQGKDEAELQALADTWGLSDTIFTGHITDIRLLDGLYMAASLFLFPSLYDTAGLVVREAAVMGTPSVVTAGGAPAECVEDGENGLCCGESAEELAGAVTRFLRGMTPEEQTLLGENARRTIPLGWDVVMDDVERRYAALCAGGVHA